jgi:hypothetical protein
MPKINSKRMTFKNKYLNANTLAAEERKAKVERMNNLLKLYLKYYDTKLENRELHEILDKLFLKIQELLEPNEENPGEDLYEYIEDLTEYVDEHIDKPTNESRATLLQFARIKKILREYSKDILHALRDKKESRAKAQALMENMNNDDSMRNLISGMSRTGIRGGTRKLRKH